MNASQKRKGRWGYTSLFGSRAASKVIILDRPPPTFPKTTSTTDMSRDSHQNSGAAAKFRRRGSKVLSILGFRPTKGEAYNNLTLAVAKCRSASRVGNTSSTTPSERDVAPAVITGTLTPLSVEDVRASYKDLTPLKIPISQRVDIPIAPDVIPAQIPFAAKSKTSHPAINATPEISLDTQQSRVISLHALDRRHDVTGLRHSKSMPGLAHHLSHKLSSTFGNPTIVHRPNLGGRPSLEIIKDSTVTVGSSPNPQESPKADTDISAFSYNGSVSPEGRSTAKTSLESNIANILTMTKSRPEKVIPISATVSASKPTELEHLQSPLTTIQESPKVVKPTIITVETTAIAKIFFETHFNSVLSGHATPRSLRRHELEVKLLSNSLSPEERHRERCLWADQESEYLRHSRVTKTKSHLMTGSKGVAIAGYEVIRILGKGSFGVVRLVRERSENDYASAAESTRKRLRSDASGTKRNVYAMKVIRKSDMLRNSQEGHLRAERDFLVASEKSRWVVPLIASFQDTTNLYLVMEYMIGGDFLGLLIRCGQLKEKRSRWYVAEMILCIEEAHRLRWIHRDVKPDNFLISSSGHLKISDFGLAFDGHWSHDQTYFNNHRYSLLEKLGIKIEGDSVDRAENSKAMVGKKLADILMGGREARHRKDRHERSPSEERLDNEGVLQWRNKNGRRKLARSVVGTSQYMAPEVIRGELYDGRCDWWSVGIILFECLYGWTPFVGENRQDTKANILSHTTEFRFPATSSTEKKYRVSHEAKDLINKMLQEKEHRLCSKKYLMNDYEEGRHAHSSSGRLPTRELQDFQGHFVFPDDATDIKTHPFFHGISWDNLHLTKPPDVPNVKNRYDTRYFDEEEPISDVNDASSTSSLQEQELSAQEAYEAGIAAAYAAAMAKAGNIDRTSNIHEITRLETAKIDAVAAVGGVMMFPAGKKGLKAKEKKRPRDRILRDTNVAKQVLELRKKGAFLGYTYRRPKPVLTGEEKFSCKEKGSRGRLPTID